MSPAARQPRLEPHPSLPRGPHSLTREQVAQNQRLRLLLAMIDVIGEKGYVATTVADVIAVAGVSRKAFYQHFAGKDECFLATFDAIAAESRRWVINAHRDAKDWRERIEASIWALFEAAIENPNAVRLGMVEITAAGSPGIERRAKAITEYEQVIRNALELPGDAGSIPATTLRMLVGGLNGILWRHVRREESGNLLELVPDLVRWATSYHPTPATIAAGPTSAPAGSPGPGGRAPGTLSLGFPRPAQRGRYRGERNLSRSFIVHSQRERILDAVTNLTAANGYASLKIEGIVAEAGVSIQTFYEHYAGKDDALLVAYELGHLKGLAIVEHAYRAQADWTQGVRAAVHALLDFLASEPAFTHLALLDAHVASPESADRAEKGITAYAQMLVPGLEEVAEHLRPPVVTVEAIASGMAEIIFDYTVRGRAHELPRLATHLTYLALAPFIGGEQAALVGTGGATAVARPILTD
jgi:AcrR family transcriptional regulator